MRIFQLFTKIFFLYYHISSRVIWYLMKYNKKKQKRQSHVQHLEPCGRRSHISSDTCGVSWHPKISFHRVVGSAVMFFFWWSGVCRQELYSLSLIDLFLFFSFSSLKNYTLALFVICILTSVRTFLIFVLGPFIEVLFVFNFFLQFQFTKYYIF